MEKYDEVKTMVTKKEVVIFLAGAEVFHALGHLYLWLSGQTVDLMLVMGTPAWSRGSFVVNGLIAAALLYWASTIKK